MRNEMLRWSFTLRVGVLEPYTDLTAQLQGAEEFPSLQDEVLAAVAEVIQRRAGTMKGLAQVRVLDVERANVRALV
jgi:hypothetical protein